VAVAGKTSCSARWKVKAPAGKGHRIVVEYRWAGIKGTARVPDALPAVPQVFGRASGEAGATAYTSRASCVPTPRPPRPPAAPGRRPAGSRGCHVHERARRCRFRNGLPLLLESFEMELDGLTHKRKDFLPCLPYRDAAGKIGNASSVGRGAFLDDHQVPHASPPLSQTGLLQRTVQRSRRHIEAWPSRYGDRAPLCRMVELTMAALRLDESDELVHLHSRPVYSGLRDDGTPFEQHLDSATPAGRPPACASRGERAGGR